MNVRLPKVLVFVTAFACVCAPAQAKNIWKIQSKLYQQSHDINWNIKSSSGVPNIISELEWQNVKMNVLELNAIKKVDSNWLWHIGTLHGLGNSGTVTDSDYNGNNRTLLFSRSQSQVYKSKQFGFHSYFTYNHNIELDNIAIGLSPSFGVRFRQFDQRFNNGVQTHCNTSGSPLPCTVPLGPISGLDSSYNSRWNGRFVGLGVSLSWSPKWYVEGRMEQRQGNYSATMDWNLRQDLQHPISQSQLANYRGRSNYLGINWQPNTNHRITLFQQNESFYLPDIGNHSFHASTCCVTTIQLNGVNWDTKATGLEWTYSFE